MLCQTYDACPPNNYLFHVNLTAGHFSEHVSSSGPCASFCHLSHVPSQPGLFQKLGDPNPNPASVERHDSKETRIQHGPSSPIALEGEGPFWAHSYLWRATNHRKKKAIFCRIDADSGFPPWHRQGLKSRPVSAEVSESKQIRQHRSSSEK